MSNPAAVKPNELPSSAPAAAEPVVAPAPAAPATPADADSRGPDLSNGLPGVFVNRRDEPAIPDKPASPAPAVDPAAAGVVASPGAASTPPPAAAPAPKQKFRLGDLDFDDENAAAHSFKTLRGMHRAKETKVQELTQMVLDLQKQMLAAQNPVPASVTVPAPGQPAQAASPEDDEAAVDRRVYNILAEKHGRDVADEWWDAENEKRNERIIAKRVNAAVAEVKKEFQPALDLVQSNAQRAAVTQLVNTMRTFRNQDGSEAYPELREENAAQLAEVRRIHTALGYPTALLYTQKGLHTAIAVYRDAMARRARALAGAPAAPTAAVTPSPAPVVDAAASGGRPSASPVAPPKVDDLVDRITAAPLRFDESLGFALNR